MDCWPRKKSNKTHPAILISDVSSFYKKLVTEGIMKTCILERIEIEIKAQKYLALCRVKAVLIGFCGRWKRFVQLGLKDTTNEQNTPKRQGHFSLSHPIADEIKKSAAFLFGGKPTA